MHLWDNDKNANSPNESASPLPFTSLKHFMLVDNSSDNWIGLDWLYCTEVCSLEGGEALNCSLLWGCTLIPVFINCSYVMAFLTLWSQNIPPINSYGHNNHHANKNIINVCNIDTMVENVWHVSPMTMNDLYNFPIGFVGHNMTVGVILGPWV